MTVIRPNASHQELIRIVTDLAERIRRMEERFADNSEGWDGNQSNVTPDRAYDANSTTTAELADVLGTLIADLIAGGFIR